MSDMDVSPAFPLTVILEDDGSITFDWDKNHPVTSIMNDWTEQDFIDLLTDAVQKAS
jgi:hypothetical protein